MVVRLSRTKKQTDGLGNDPTGTIFPFEVQNPEKVNIIQKYKSI